MIRQAVKEDAIRLAEINVFGWRDTYREFISEEILYKGINVAKKINHFENAIEQKLEETYVYDDEGIVKAMLTIGECRDSDKKGVYELWGIYVDPFMKNQGIGSQLVSFCENRAKHLGYQEVYLWTFEKNDKARAFYEKLGYRRDGKENVIEALKAKEIRYYKTME